MIFSGHHPKRVLVTGGAGFIGSHVVDLLVAAGQSVTVFDNLSSGTRERLDAHLDTPNVRLIQADLTDLQAVMEAMPGHDLVWQLGGNDDVAAGSDDTTLDLASSVIATHNVLEAMRRCRVREMLFCSASAVYGNSTQLPTPETAGPLLPVSLYGAGKLAAEAFISAYCHLFGLRAWIFRFGNIVGERMTRGAIHDFTRRLQRTPGQLEVWGDGRQRKNYLLVEECIAGMLHAYEHALLSEWQPCAVFNLGAAQSCGVMTIVDAVLRELDQRDATIYLTGGTRAWPGDQPRVDLDVSKIGELGWSARHSSTEAIRIATRRMLGEQGEQGDSPALRETATAEVR